MLVALLHVFAHPRAKGFDGPYAARQLELAKVLGVGVPDPLHQVGDPGFGAVAFQALHQVLVGKPVQAAEDLAHDADERLVPVLTNAQLAEAVAAADYRIAQAVQLHAGLHGRGFDRRTQVREALFVDGFGVAAAFFVGAVDQQQLLQQVGAQQGAPTRADESLRVVTQPVVGVAAGWRKDGHGFIPVGVQHVPQVGSVLPEAAGALGGGHEQRHAPGVGVGPLEQLHEVAHGHFGRVALVARSVARAQLARALVGGRGGLRVEADGAKRRREGAGAAIGHGRDVNALPG